MHARVRAEMTLHPHARAHALLQLCFPLLRGLLALVAGTRSVHDASSIPGRLPTEPDHQGNTDLMHNSTPAAGYAGVIVGDTHGDLTPVIKAFQQHMHGVGCAAVAQAMQAAESQPRQQQQQHQGMHRSSSTCHPKLFFLGDYVDRGEPRDQHETVKQHHHY